MPKLTVYDPSMCCSTGVCGPSVDPALVQFAQDLEHLRRRGVEIERFNLARETWAFAQNPVVRGTLGRKGTECLPLILVDGEIVCEAKYPSLDELTGLLRLDQATSPVPLRSK